MENLAWLKRRFAHRGLHDAQAGIIENSRAAAEAAMAEGCGIEIDVRRARCGTPMVFHDADLDRLTEAKGPLAERDAAELSQIVLAGTEETIPTLAEFLALVAGRVPLILEIKTDFKASESYDCTLEANVVAELAAYPHQVAVMSFDPRSVQSFRTLAPDLPRGLVAGPFRDLTYWGDLTGRQRFALRHLVYAFRVLPHFIAYDIQALPAPGPWVAHHIFRLPLLTWTVRSQGEESRAQRYADGMIFESIPPRCEEGTA